jgi:tetratricopeptide (TPR) repeat protein
VLKGRGKQADVPLRKKLVFSLITTVLFFTLLEAGLALFGVRPRLRQEDPFVGFVSSIPLFVEGRDADGRPLMVTADNKRGIFNVQQFPRDKPPGTYRIFCLGGSTTYGRPYSDATSFSSWLRELLPVADPGRRWEVINAGGISYASYRVARLTDELLEYDPDLFVVYTGHNEFLEERTYGDLRDMPGPLKAAVGLLARTRTWAALSALLNRFRPRPAAESEGRSLLPNEVQAKLDHSAGLDLYERDDPLRDGIIAHYRFSLNRMAEVIRAAGADIVFITPASNLKDFSPFKSQHSDGLEESQRARSEALLAEVRTRMRASEWEEALELSDEALEIDPRFADLHYRRGEALLALGRVEDAEASLRRARDEDVCPLRALSSMQAVVAEVAKKNDAPLVDFAGLVEELTRMKVGHPIAGAGFFLDHVHPTIEGHRRLAVAVVEALIELGAVQPQADWGEPVIAEVAARVEGTIDPKVHAAALANLALTLAWAGKQEDSWQLAFRALESGSEDPTVLMMAGRHYAVEGKKAEALEFFQRALKAEPGSPVIHSQIGFMRAGWRELEAAAAHFFLASLLWRDNDVYHQQLGFMMAERGRPDIALTSLLEAHRINPANRRIEARITQVRSEIGEDGKRLTPPELDVTRYRSGYPRTLAQTQADDSGRRIPHGIWTEWFDGGGLKRFTDYAGGVPHGVSMSWDEGGKPLERLEYRHGVLTPTPSHGESTEASP